MEITFRIKGHVVKIEKDQTAGDFWFSFSYYRGPVDECCTLVNSRVISSLWFVFSLDVQFIFWVACI